MTVSTTATSIAYTGTGATTPLAVPFIFFDADELDVISRVIATGVETTLTLATHYNVAGGNGATGTVTPTSGANFPTTVQWHIVRATQKLQETDYVENDPFPAQSHERALDRLTAQTQEIGGAVSRTVRVERTSPLTETQLTLPAPEAGQAIAWNAAANGFINVSIPQEPEVAQIVNSSLVRATGTPDFRTLEARFREIGDVRDWGIQADGVTDDTDAWNNLFTAINAGSVAAVMLPGASVINETLIPITASSWWIRGNAAAGSRINMGAGAGTAGVFFQIGDPLNVCNDWVISNLRLTNLNSGTLNGGGNPFDVRNSANGYIDNIRLNSTNGLITIGSTADGTSSARTKVSRIQAVPFGAAGGKTVDLQSSTGHFFLFCNFGCEGTAAASFRGMHMHPQATDAFDTGKFVACEWNYPAREVLTVVEMDATNHQIGSQQFVNCVFDQGDVANIHMHIDAIHAEPSHFGNILFSGCISNGGSNVATQLLLDNTGGRPFDVTWIGGGISNPGSNGCVRVTGGNRVDLTLQTKLASFSPVANPGAAVRVGAGVSGVQVLGCNVWTRPQNDTGSPHQLFTHLVEFEGDASNCIIANNNASLCTDGVAITNSIAPANVSTIILRDNLGPFGPETVARVTTNDATVTTLAELPLAASSSYHVQATVIANSGAGGERASYQLVGTFYRTGSMVAALQGTVTVLHSAEADPTWDCVLDTSGNNMRIRVTGDAANTVHWAGGLTFIRQAQAA